MSNLPVVESSKFTSTEVALLRKTYAKDLNDTELSLFLKQSEALNLNPFTKEIYGLIVKERLVLITSIAGLRKIAHQSGTYLGCDVRVKMDGDKLISAEAVVKKLVAGHTAEFRAEVLNKEYNTGNNQWAKMPVTMLKKVAEAHALRMAYPSAETLYEESELGAIQRKPMESEKATAATEKFLAAEPRDITPHPDTHEDLPLTVTKDPVEKPVETVDNFAGDYVIGVGKNTGKKIKDLPRSDVEAFLQWAYAQDKLSEKAQEYAHKAEQYLS
jgi:phage recombination protein Bet